MLKEEDDEDEEVEGAWREDALISLEALIFLGLMSQGRGICSEAGGGDGDARRREIQKRDRVMSA